MSANTTEKYWMTDIKDLNKVSTETAELIFKQAETLLSETTDTAKTISLKAERIMTILIPIATGIIVYLIQNKLANLFEFLPLTALLCFLVVGVSFRYSYANFEKYIINTPGEYPSTIMTSKYIDNNFDSRFQYVNMLLSISTNLQARIEINIQQNTKRVNNNIKSLRTLGYLILCPIAGYLLSLLSLGHCF